jgi:hypothetical protein
VWQQTYLAEAGAMNMRVLQNHAPTTQKIDQIKGAPKLSIA